MQEELLILLNHVALALPDERVGHKRLESLPTEDPPNEPRVVASPVARGCCIELEKAFSFNTFQMLISGEVEADDLQMVETKNRDEPDELS